MPLETAGPGELVYIVAAREAAEAMPNRFVPVDHAIVGIADAVEGLADGGSAAGSREPGKAGKKPRKPRKAGR